MSELFKKKKTSRIRKQRKATLEALANCEAINIRRLERKRLKHKATLFDISGGA